MKFDITEFILKNNIISFSVIEISDKVYLDFGNDINILNSINTIIIYDDETDKVYIENAWIEDEKTYIYIEYIGSTIIYEFDNKTNKRIFP